MQILFRCQARWKRRPLLNLRVGKEHTPRRLEERLRNLLRDQVPRVGPVRHPRVSNNGDRIDVPDREGRRDDGGGQARIPVLVGLSDSVYGEGYGWLMLQTRLPPPTDTHLHLSVQIVVLSARRQTHPDPMTSPTPTRTCSPPPSREGI